MPKPFLKAEDSLLESQIIETMLAGLKLWRPDLSYPESHSDMQGCVRALMSCFEVKRRPLPTPLRVLCHECDGIGHFIKIESGCRHLTTCVRCNGRGHFPSEL